MKKIFDYVVEGRPKGSKNKMSKGAAIDPDKVKSGKDAEKNGTEGMWGINEPVDNTPVVDIPKEQLNKNMKRLRMKFDAEEDFFIQGKAGWGKTSIIEDMAKKYGYEVITVYLDKIAAVDLGGLPIPIQNKEGKAVQVKALPAWARKMLDNKDKKYLLFLDEMNQAQPDVMNALMPIVLKHEICEQEFDNFFVGAAGNFESENGAVNELSGPLKSRFKPIIEWESNTPETWKQAFDFMRNKWKGQATEDFINKLEDNQNLFDNPREIDLKIIRHAIKLKARGDNDIYDAEDFLDRLQGLVREEPALTRSEEANLSEIADAIYEFITSKSNEKSVGRSGNKKNMNMIPDAIMDALKQGIVQGFIDIGDGKQYGISKENIYALQGLDPDEMNAEMVERAVEKILNDGAKFKYNKDSEWKKAGYSDPNED